MPVITADEIKLRLLAPTDNSHSPDCLGHVFINTPQVSLYCTYIVVAQPFNRRLDHTNRRQLVQHGPTFVGDPLSAENLDLLT